MFVRDCPQPRTTLPDDWESRLERIDREDALPSFPDLTAECGPIEPDPECPLFSWFVGVTKCHAALLRGF